MFRHSRYLVLCVAAVVTGAPGIPLPQARGDTILYATGFAGQVGTISRVDVDTSTVTVIDSVQDDQPDSLIFANPTTLIYTNRAQLAAGIGQVRTDGSGDTAVAGGFTAPVDLCLMPNGVDILVSGFGDGTIYEITNPLTAPVKSVFATPASSPNPEGITFDNSGRLFANLGTRDAGNDKWVAQLDPVTGAVLGTSAHYQSLDGMTFDPFTGMLFSTLRDSSELLETNPNTLATTLLPFTDALGNAVPELDGIESDGQGDLFVASNSTQVIYEYDIATGTVIWTSPFISGLDDMTPMVGLGSAPSVPEPASLSVLALGLGGLMLRRRRR